MMEDFADYLTSNFAGIRDEHASSMIPGGEKLPSIFIR